MALFIGITNKQAYERLQKSMENVGKSCLSMGHSAKLIFIPKILQSIVTLRNCIILNMTTTCSNSRQFLFCQMLYFYLLKCTICGTSDPECV